MRPTNARLNTRLISFATAVMLLCCCAFTSAFAQQKPEEEFGKPSRIDRQVSKMVSALIQNDHLSTSPLDNKISERAFKMYVKSLDPAKVYFLKSDIEEFSQWREKLDDQMKSGKYDAAFAIFKRFLKRVDERVAVALELIDEDHDFSIDEELKTDPDMMDFAADQDAARELWRKRIKYNLLVLKQDQNDDKKKQKDTPKEKLRKRYKAFANRMKQTDNEDVVEMYVTAVTSSFDPHTSYMSKGTFENFLISMSLQLEGIGATLQATDDGYTVIKRIVPGGAADKQGELEVEDKIVAVAQDKDGEFSDVIGMKLDDVVKQIRGKAGTIVRLSVVSENSNEIRNIEIVREKIKLEDSAARGAIFEEGKKADGSPLKIGVIDLPSFYADMGSSRNAKDFRSTTRDVDKILTDFKTKNVDAVVLDLRRNGGGSLREAIDCTGLFIDSGPVVQVKDAYGKILRHNDEKPGMSWDKPLVVLTSKFSASASEILAGAVQDYKRGLVVGDTTTHGKGTVQNLLNLNQLLLNIDNPPNVFGALKITMQQFYRPNGDSTQKRGVLADVVLPSISDKMDVGETDLDFPVEFDRIPAANFKSVSMVSSDIVKQLQVASQDRISKSEKFQGEIRKIKKYVDQKERKTVSLNEEKFLARRKEFNADKQDEKTIEDQVNPDKKIERTYYLDEVLRITAEYYDRLNGSKVASK